MSFIDGLGIAAGVITNTKWKLVGIDNPKNIFNGQFEAEQVTENVGSRFPETTPSGQQNPAIQFSSTETENITFRARIYRASPVAGELFEAVGNPVGSAFDTLNGSPIIGSGSVRDQIEKLKSLSRINEKLKRPEQFHLVIGSEMRFDVFVKSPGRIVYDRIRADGTIRGASFDMQLIKIRPENQLPEAGLSTAAAIKASFGITTTAGNIASRANLINIPGASLHTIDKIVTIKDGDTFEGIAASEYGNALLGDILRRAQPEKLDLKIDENKRTEIITIKRNEITQIAVEPQAIPLRESEENKSLLNEFLALRGMSTTLII